MAVRSRRPGEAQPGFRRTWVLLPIPRLPPRVPVSCSRGGLSSIRTRLDAPRPSAFWARRPLPPDPCTVWVARSSTPYPCPIWIHPGPPCRGLGGGVPYGRCSEEQVARISVPARREEPNPSTFWVSSPSRARHPCSFWMPHGPPCQDPGSGIPCGRYSEEQVARISVPARREEPNPSTFWVFSRSSLDSSSTSLPNFQFAVHHSYASCPSWSPTNEGGLAPTPIRPGWSWSSVSISGGQGVFGLVCPMILFGRRGWMTIFPREYLPREPAGTLAAGMFTAGTFAAGTFAAGTLAAGTSAAGTFAAGTLPREPFAAGIFRRGNFRRGNLCRGNPCRGNFAAGTFAAGTLPREPLPREPLPRESLPRELLPREPSAAGIICRGNLLPRELLPREHLPREPFAAGTPAAGTSAAGIFAAGTSAAGTFAAGTLPRELLPREHLPREPLPRELLPRESFAAGTLAAGTLTAGAPMGGE